MSFLGLLIMRCNGYNMMFLIFDIIKLQYFDIINMLYFFIKYINDREYSFFANIIA